MTEQFSTSPFCIKHDKHGISFFVCMSIVCFTSEKYGLMSSFIIYGSKLCFNHFQYTIEGDMFYCNSTETDFKKMIFILPNNVHLLLYGLPSRRDSG